MQKWTVQIRDGQESDALISSVDLLSAFMKPTEIDLPQDQVFDGQSFVFGFKGKDNKITGYCTGIIRCTA